VLWACAGSAIVSAALALTFLPRRARAAAGEAEVIAAGTGEAGPERAELEL
jgi:hypothetical protein